MIFHLGSLAQTEIQYTVVDNEYFYQIQLQNVTDADDAKVPMALLHELFGSMPAFDQESTIFSILTRKNVSKPLIRERLEEHDYVFILLQKEERNNSDQEDRE